MLLAHTTFATDVAACAVFARAFTPTVCSWYALPVPPLMQLVHSLHASSLYSTRVLLARTTRTADDVACALFARLEHLVDSCAPGASGIYSTRAPWQARTSPPMLQLVQSPNASCPYSIRVPRQAQTAPPILELVQSPNASSLYSTRVPWRARTALPMLQLMQSPERLGSFLDPGSLAGTNFPADATACPGS